MAEPLFAEGEMKTPPSCILCFFRAISLEITDLLTIFLKFVKPIDPHSTALQAGLGIKL